MEISNLSNQSVKPRVTRSLSTTTNQMKYEGQQIRIGTEAAVFSAVRPAEIAFTIMNSGLPIGTLNDLPRRTITFGQAPNSFLLKPCQVKREDSEGTSSTESSILDQQTLEQELQIAIKEENYAQAAKIRDNLILVHEDSKNAVFAANSQFYNSFRNGDLAAMQALWLKSENLSLVHPGFKGISGYELVMASWELVWADFRFPLNIEVKDVNVHVRGDVGYVTCAEMVRTNGKRFGRQFATNLFEVGGQWFISLHHASDVNLLRHICGSF